MCFRCVRAVSAAGNHANDQDRLSHAFLTRQRTWSQAVVKYAPRLLVIRLKVDLLEASDVSTWTEYMEGSQYLLPRLKANKAEKGRQRAATKGALERGDSRTRVSFRDEPEVCVFSVPPPHPLRVSAEMQASATCLEARVGLSSNVAQLAQSLQRLMPRVYAHAQDDEATDHVEDLPVASSTPAAAGGADALADADTPPSQTRTTSFAAHFAKRAANVSSAAPPSAPAAPAAAPPNTSQDLQDEANKAVTDSSSPPPSPPGSRPASPPPSPPPPDDKHKGRGVLGGAAHKALKVMKGKSKKSMESIDDVSSSAAGSGSMGSSGKLTKTPSSKLEISSPGLTDQGVSNKQKRSSLLGEKQLSGIKPDMVPAGGQLYSAELGGEGSPQAEAKSTQPKVPERPKVGTVVADKDASLDAKDKTPKKMGSMMSGMAGGMAGMAGGMKKMGEAIKSKATTSSNDGGPDKGGDKVGVKVGGDKAPGKADVVATGKMSDDERHEKIGAAIGRRDFVRALVLIDEGLASNSSDAILKSYRGWVKDLARQQQSSNDSGSVVADVKSPTSPASAKDTSDEEVYKWRDANAPQGRATLSQLRTMIENDELDPFNCWVWNKSTVDEEGNATWLPLVKVIERDEAPEFKGDVDPERAAELMLSLLLFASSRVLLERMATATVNASVYECMEIVICAMKRRSGESGNGLQALKDMLPIEGPLAARSRSRSASIGASIAKAAGRRGFVKYREEVPAADGAVSAMVSTWLQELVDANPLVIGCKWEPIPGAAAPKKGTPLVSPALVRALEGGQTTYARDELRSKFGLSDLRVDSYIQAGESNTNSTGRAPSPTYYRPVPARDAAVEDRNAKLYRPREWLELMITCLVELSTEMPTVLRSFGCLKPGWLQGESLLNHILTLQLTSGNQNSTRGALEDPFLLRTFQEDPWLLTIPAFWTEQTWSLFDDSTQKL